MKAVLVTGGAGFIGSNFLLMMVKKYPDYHFYNLDSLTYAGNLENLREIENSGNYHFIKGSITDAELVYNIFRDHHIDTVVHFAAESHVDRSILGPDVFIETNVKGTFILLEAARKYWIEEKAANQHRFHHISTDEVYGSLGETGYFTEETPYAPNSPYSASKASSDHLVRAYHHTFGMDVVTTNCSNNYGPYQFPEKLIPLMIHNALNGKDLPVYGDGKNIRDWLYVEDHCLAIDRVMHTGKAGETYNVGGNNEWKNIDIVHLICDLIDEKTGRAGKESTRNQIKFVKDRPGHDRRYAIDASKIKNELNWEPEVNFEEGIRRTIDWYLNNTEWVKNVIDGKYTSYYEKNYGNK
jgi:dTDP-glucose 4,6-dehydratase